MVELMKGNTCQKTNKNNYIAEIACLIIASAIIVIGLIFDLSDIGWIIVDNLRELSMTILQINASISAIAIAIVAIVGGLVSEEHYGVSLSDYYLNIKPVIFKQKRIIITEIVVIALNTIAYVFGLYNLTFAFLWVSCLLIIISVVEIYSVFRGKNVIAKEIEDYIEDRLFNLNHDFEAKADMFEKYIKYWSSINQPEIDYENEKERYLKSIDSLLDSNPEKALATITENVAFMIKKCSDVSRQGHQYRCIDILQTTYMQVWLHVLNNDCKHIDCSFELYDECDREIIQTMFCLSMEDFERYVHWDSLSELILRVDIYCHKKELSDIDAVHNHIKHVRWIPSSIGAVLQKKMQNGEHYEKTRWVYSLGTLFLGNANIPNDAIRYYSVAKCQLAFAYYYALLKAGLTDIAKGIFSKYHFDSSGDGYEKTVFTFLVLCYTYYIAERESLDCITIEERNAAKEVLEEFKNQDLFMDIVYDYLWRNPNTDIMDAVNEINRIMDDYERMPLDRSCKRCIVNNVVRDFQLLTMVLACAFGVKDIQVNNIITGQNSMSWYSLYFGSHKEETLKLLHGILSVLSQEAESNIKLLESGFDNLGIEVAKKYKEYSISEARETFDSFSSKNKSREYIADVERKAIEHLKSKLSPFTKEPLNPNKKSFDLLKYTLPIRFFDEETIKHIIIDLETLTLKKIVQLLVNEKALVEYERSRSEESDYLEFVKDDSHRIMVGPDFAFSPYSYKMRDAFEKACESKQRVNMGCGNVGILLDDMLGISLDRLSISTRPMSLEECDYEMDEDTGLYKFAPTSGVYLLYTKEELEDYLRNEMIVLNFTLDVAIDLIDKGYGYLVIRKKISSDTE